ncbi:rhomboid family intramembrane serine protease [Microlunatus antarcticus]|uniref:Rhomboid family protein n=1 Tax=Microlunatus antarcticus TaxID=53388 RepID=A0A7W5P731_9ACTN|nr:rhomboid family intramembrane serine protease [Microlunatus antarcticus]MBB3326962.1 hypothetical protein [Microlunatus antarcticus]
MSTAQGGLASVLIYVVVYVATLRTVYGHLRSGRAARRPHPVAVVLWLVVAVPSLLQLVRPQIYAALARDPVLTGHGEWWRLLTSVLVQDGGLVGTAYNLVTLALTAPAATALWRPLRAVAVFVAGALVFNLPATFAWHDGGGGNSGATFFLATSMLGVLVVGSHARQIRTAALIVAGCGIALLVLGDAHGEAVLAGLLVGAAVAAASRARRVAGERAVR